MEIDTLTASTSRKINHAIYGGEQFESSDHFVSLSASLEDGEDVVKAHRELMLMCKEMANKSVADEILKLQAGIPWSAFMEVLKTYRLKKTISETDINKMNRLQKTLYHEMQLLMRAKEEKTLQNRNQETTYESTDNIS